MPFIPVSPILLQAPQPPAEARSSSPQGVPRWSHQSRGVDPRASSALLAMGAAYKALTTFSVTWDISSDLPVIGFAPPRPGTHGAPNPSVPSKPLRVRVTVRVQKPSQFAITTDEDGVQGRVLSQVLCDGKTLYTLRALPAPAPTRYVHDALPPRGLEGQILWMVFTQVRLYPYSPMLGLLRGQNPLWSVQSNLKELAISPPTEIDGVPVQTITAILTSRDGDERLTYYIGERDHLPRRIVYTVHQRGQQIMVTENVTALEANPTLPPRTFVFVPPPGAIEIPHSQAAPRPAMGQSFSAPVVGQGAPDTPPRNP